MVDPGRVRRLLDSLTGYRAELAELASFPAEEYRGRDAVAGRYFVQAAAQTCIDLANHVISSEGWRVPADYADAFTVLEENGVVAPEPASRLRELERLRNLLVHAYATVDDALIHRSLNEGVDDLNAFATAIAPLAEPPSRDGG